MCTVNCQQEDEANCEMAPFMSFENFEKKAKYELWEKELSPLRLLNYGFNFVSIIEKVQKL